MGKMAVEPKTFPAGTAAIPEGGKVRSPAVPTVYRRCFVWTQIIVAFLFLEFAIWAPTPEIRNRWAAIAAITILILVLTDVLLDGSPWSPRSSASSLHRLGLGLPKMLGASVVLGIGLATIVCMVILVSWAGGEIPANPTWFPNLQSAWGYVIWAMLQEFLLQSFFFNRCEELYGSAPAVWMASTLFAAAHLPNPVLTTAALIGALFFCEMFRRYRSIYVLGIVHAMLGLTLAILMPDSLLHHMRVGIGYLRY
ncbi:MAG TPA: CPBP family intramembrane glutamic endopeptidase [Terriglobales bacterium]|nr:CPBP family intramembrane glutamic endopeptidase [Terriglobales bacterium]